MCLLPLEVTDHLTFARVGVEGAVAEIGKWGSEFTGRFFFDDFSINFALLVRNDCLKGLLTHVYLNILYVTCSVKMCTICVSIAYSK